MAGSVRGSSVVGGAGVTSLATGSFTSATGDTIAVWFNYGTSTDPTSVTDNKGNTYTQRAKVTRFGSFTSFLYTCENATGGAGTIVTLNIGFTEYPTLAAAAIQGVLTSGALDALQTSGTDTAQPWTLATGVLAQADEIIFGFVGSDSGGVSDTFTEGSGMTKLGEVVDSNNYWTGALAYRVVASTATYTQSWTNSGGGSNSTQIIVSFKAAAGGGGGVTCTLSVNDAGDTVASTAAVSIAATLARTDTSDTLSAATTESVTATLARTDTADSLSAVAGVAVVAAHGVTDTGDAVSAATTSVIVAQLSATDIADSLASDAFIGAAPLTLTLAVTDAADTLAGSAAVAVVSALSATDAADTVSGAAAVRVTTSTGATDAADTMASAVFVGSAPVTASLAVTDTADSLASAAVVPVVVAASVTDDADAFASAAVVRILASLGATDAADSMSAFLDTGAAPPPVLGSLIGRTRQAFGIRDNRQTSTRTNRQTSRR